MGRQFWRTKRDKVSWVKMCPAPFPCCHTALTAPLNCVLSFALFAELGIYALAKAVQAWMKKSSGSSSHLSVRRPAVGIQSGPRCLHSLSDYGHSELAFTMGNSGNDCQASNLTWRDVEGRMVSKPALAMFAVEEFPDVGDVSALRDQ